MEILKVTAAEVDLVVPLFDKYRMTYDQPSDLDVARSFLEDRIANKESVVFLAKNEQGEGIGFTQLYPSFSSVSAVRTWILNDLYVVDELRGQGIARKILNAARDYAMSTEAKGIGLETSKDNLSTQRLYWSLGYERQTEYRRYFLSLEE